MPIGLRGTRFLNPSSRYTRCLDPRRRTLLFDTACLKLPYVSFVFYRAGTWTEITQTREREQKVQINSQGERTSPDAILGVSVETDVCRFRSHLLQPLELAGMRLRSRRRSCAPLSCKSKCASSCTFLLFSSFHVSGQLYVRVRVGVRMWAWGCWGFC